MEHQKEERWIEFEACRTVDDSEKEHNFDLFGDPDPYEIFFFSFTVPAAPAVPPNENAATSTNNTHVAKDNILGGCSEKGNMTTEDRHEREISITLKGFKHEHERIFDSTGLTLWRASKLLCDFMCSNTHYIEDKTVLELGAGLGLCGLLAYHLNATSVVMTDGDTDVLAEMRQNVNCNLKTQKEELDDMTKKKNVYSQDDVDGGDDTSVMQASDKVIPCRQLRWGKSYVEKFKSSLEKLSTYKNGETGGSFDVIIASDVIYVDYILDDLFDTITALLSQSQDAKFLLAYARRAVDISLVFECAKKHRLEWTEPDGVEGVYIFSRLPSEL
mmetsp:Transcript_10564/g.15917  ORF Transcript_10564/g.15917 Transcript_10564/m.15917 type:complete len:330 (+) Transcript_10564:89-1078(+)